MTTPYRRCAVDRRQLIAGGCATAAVGSVIDVRPIAAQIGARAMRFYYAYGAGGAGDGLARLIAAKMGEVLNVPTIVENKAGASGRMGTKAALTADPDGMHILFSPIAPISLHPSLFPRLDYDPLTDALPIAQLVTYDFCCVASPAMKVSNLKEFAAKIKANPAEASCALVGAGGVQFLLAYMFAKLMGVEIRHVFYRGSGAIMTDIMSGQVPFSFLITSEAIELHNAGKVKILVTSGTARSPLLPDVPTFKQAGFDLEGEGWYGLLAQSKLPAAKAAELEKAAIAVMKMPDVREKALKVGYVPTGADSKAFGRIIKADLDKWGPVIRASGVKPTD